MDDRERRRLERRRMGDRRIGGEPDRLLGLVIIGSLGLIVVALVVLGIVIGRLTG